MGNLVIHGNIRVNAVVPSGTGDNVLTTDPTTGDVGQIGVIDTSTFVSKTLPDGQIIVGNGSNVATAVTPTGDVTITNAGVTAIGTGVIVNNDINASAGIVLTKLAALTASRAAVTDSSGFIVASAVTATEQGYSSGVTSAIQTQIDSKVTSATLTTNGDIFYRAGGVVTRLPIGTNGYVLGVTAGLPVWEAKQPVPNGGTTAQYLAKNSNTDGDVSWVTLTTAKITDITASAAELNIMDGVTASTAEINYIGGVTSLIQTQLDAKQATITGSASTVVSVNLTSNRATIINGSGKFAAAATTDTEIGYVSGVTSPIQGQIDAKLGTSLAQNAIFVGNGSNQAAAYAAGSNGQVLTISAGVPTWTTPGSGGTVTSIDVSGTGTGMSFTGGPVTTTGTITLTGTLDADNGGTGFASYAIGDILHATGATTLTKLASVSAGSFLRSAGVTTASTWSTVKLPDTMSALGVWVANSLNTTVNLTAAANQSIRVNSGGTAWEAYTPFQSTSGNWSMGGSATTFTLGGGATASELRFLEPNGGGSSYVGFKSPTLAANTVYDLPNAFPAVSGYVLSSTDAGVMSWVASGSGITNGAANNELMKSDGTNAVASGLFSTAAGDITLGTGLSGGTRNFTMSGSATDVAVSVTTKGAGSIILQQGDATGYFKIESAGTFGVFELLAHLSSTDTVTPVVSVQRTTSGTPALGIGASINYLVETAPANNEIGATIDAVTTNVGSGTEAFDLVFKTMSTGAAAAERIRITSDGRIYGTSLHNNAGAVTGTTNQYIASGTYTPTLTNTTNIGASTAYLSQWVRVGNVVTVSGKIDIDITTTLLASDLGVSLPIASAFTNERDCGGIATSDSEQTATIRIKADATNDRAQFVWTGQSGTGNLSYSFTFTYLML